MVWASDYKQLNSLFVPPHDELRMQKDGDLVFFKISFDGNREKPVWRSNTKGLGSCAVLENDGELAIYDEEKNKIWSSNKCL